MSHTKEPWEFLRIDETDATWLACEIWPAPDNDGDPLGAPVATFVCNDKDARRIVACVNACAGWPTLFLESVVTIGSTLQNKSNETVLALHKAEQQRNELQRKVEISISHLYKINNELYGVGAPNHSPEYFKLRSEIYEVISTLESEK